MVMEYDRPPKCPNNRISSGITSKQIFFLTWCGRPVWHRANRLEYENSLSLFRLTVQDRYPLVCLLQSVIL